MDYSVLFSLFAFDKAAAEEVVVVVVVVVVFDNCELSLRSFVVAFFRGLFVLALLFTGVVSVETSSLKAEDLDLRECCVVLL